MADAPGVGGPASEQLPFARVLVTGADGFVGRYFVPALASRLGAGARLVLATRDAAGDSGDTVQLDLEDATSVAEAIAAIRPDLVVHLAGQASVGRSAGMAGTTWVVNLGGSVALARALAEYAPNCTMLFVSSAEVYGLTFNYERVTEASELRPQSAYARSKAAAEWALADILPSKARLIVARPANHSGAGQEQAFVVPAFAAQIAAAERGTAASIRVGNMEAERDFLDVRDVVAAYLALLARAPALPLRATFNIASGTPVRIGTLLEGLRAMSGTATPVEPDSARMRPSEIARAVIDASALAEATGWLPTYGLGEMLADVLADQRARADTLLNRDD